MNLCATRSLKGSIPQQPTIASRASWTGQLALGPLKLPIKAYPALVAPSHGPLHQIHVGCGNRISQRKVCVAHGELAADEIGKAFEYGPNDPLTFTDEELNSLAPVDDRTIHAEHLLPLDKLDLSLLSGRSMHLVPAHASSRSEYARAVVALGSQFHWAVGRMVLSDQQRIVAVREEAQRLLLFVLHWPHHRRVSPIADMDLDQIAPAELRALEKALLPLHQGFDWQTYRDEESDRLNALIETKVAARHASTEVNATRKTSKQRPAAEVAPTGKRRRAA
jgi:DNA end-binding protein Ku